MQFTTREQVIKSREKFWTFNRLHKYYWNLRTGIIHTYRTELNKKTGYYELSKEYKRQYNIQ